MAGDELIWLLRRLNEEWGVAVLLAEHRLERCLAAADRVIAMDSGALSFDGPPRDFLAWSHEADQALTTPAARLFSLAGIDRLPVGVRDARQMLDERQTARQLGRVAWGRGVLRRPEAAEGEARAFSANGPSVRSSAQGKEGSPPPRQDQPAIHARDLWVEVDSVEMSRATS